MKTLAIFHDIGPARDGGIDAATIARRLDALGDVSEIMLRINSRGGSAYDGMAIHNLLSQHPARITCLVMGVAASAATLPMLAAEQIHCPANAMLMIHNPVTFAFGGEAEFEAAIEQLQTLKAACVEMYAARSGLSAAEIVRMLDAETWMDGRKAVELGFADSVDAPVAVPAAAPAMSWALPLKFQHAPEEFSRLLSMTAGLQAAPAAITPPPVAVATDSTVTDERKRIADIIAVCRLAGCPERAEGWIARGVPLKSVQHSLREALCSSRQPVGGESAGELSAGPDMRFGREYDADRETFEANQVSRESYIRSRRIDAGMEALVPDQSGQGLWSDNN